MKATRIYLAIVIALLGVIAVMAYKFVVAGSTAEGDDGRVALLLAPAERVLMLGEMRAFVAGLQAITDALAREDMKAVASAARGMGMPRNHDVPLALMAKLPLDFKTLAFEVHRGFDAMAMDAEAVGDPKHALGQLSAILGNCVACHARYEVGPAP